MKKITPLFTCLVIGLVLLGSACRPPQNGPLKTTVNTTFCYTDTLDVALYPYVPRIDQFKSELSERWQATHPKTYLNMISEWDCYDQDPPDSIEVFVFDAIYLNNFASRGFLSPLEEGQLGNWKDVLPYAREGATINGKIMAVPQIGCGSILFYRKGDVEMARAGSIEALHKVLGFSPDQSVWPTGNTGLLMDFSGKTTDACYYVVEEMTQTDQYSTRPPMPKCKAGMLASFLFPLKQTVRLCGEQQAAYADKVPYMRGLMFSEGFGRAAVGFTESMSVMGSSIDQMEMKPFPFGQANFTPFYSDMAALNPKTAPRQKDLALELLNLITSSDYLIACFEGRSDWEAAQYLMPVRTSVFDALAEKYPKYAEMKTMVDNANPKAFLLGIDSRNWLENNKACIRDALLHESKEPGEGKK